MLPQEPCKVRQGNQVTERIMYAQTLLKFTQLNSVSWHPVTLPRISHSIKLSESVTFLREIHYVKYVSVQNVFQAKFA